MGQKKKTSQLKIIKKVIAIETTKKTETKDTSNVE